MVHIPFTPAKATSVPRCNDQVGYILDLTDGGKQRHVRTCCDGVWAFQLFGFC